MEEFIFNENYKLSKKTNNLFKPIKYKIKNGCFICISHSTNNMGYPRVYRNGKKEFIHRYIYTLYNGEIPKDKVIMHKCDNKLCINPNHLLLGTQQDNMNDMKNKGRSPKSLKGNTYNRITKDKFLEILKLLDEEKEETIGEKDKRIANIARVSALTVGRIRRKEHKWFKDEGYL